ncbi:MAG: PD40 domain-containing protein [Actinobacteria bacterium]|nr:PD40 domain-containing protein [Actinomycetota bacterium]
MTVWPAGAAQPNASNLNLQAGVTTPNMVIVPLGAGGQISLFNERGNTDLIVDVLGWFPTGVSFTGLVPARLMDTRVGGSTIDGLFAGGGAVGPNSVTNLTISNRGGVPASGVGAVALNVTATGPTSDSFVTVWPAGAAQPNASNLNLRANITTPNMVIVALGAGGQISLFNERGNTDLIVDVLGWFPITTAAASTIRASVTSAAAQATGGNSLNPAVSADGRYVTYFSTATNLVASDTNGTADVFLYDRVLATTTRVSVSSTGTQSNSGSGLPAISADGRYVSYRSGATNLVTGDTNGENDVFLYDRVLATTTRISVTSAGAQATGGASETSTISSDGRYISYYSYATNLVALDTNSQPDVFLYDRILATTTRVSVTSAGVQAAGGESLDPAISDDGRYITYHSFSPTLVAVDTNDTWDIFLYDRILATTTRVSVSSAGVEAAFGGLDPAISADGRYITYNSTSANLVAGDSNALYDIFLYDRVLATTARVNVTSAGAQATGGNSTFNAVSGDGRYVTYQSSATNLVGSDSNGVADIFVYDRTTGETTRASVSTAGTEANGGSELPDISDNGRFICFTSGGTNLVTGDTNTVDDVFLRDLGTV